MMGLVIIGLDVDQALGTTQWQREGDGIHTEIRDRDMFANVLKGTVRKLRWVLQRL